MKRLIIILLLIYSEYVFCQFTATPEKIELRICGSVENETIQEFAKRNFPSDSSMIFLKAYQIPIWPKWDSIAESRILFFKYRRKSNIYDNSELGSFLYLPIDKKGNYIELFLGSYIVNDLPIKIEEVFIANADNDSENELCVLYSTSEVYCEKFTCKGIFYQTAMYKIPVDLDNPYIFEHCSKIESGRFSSCKCENDSTPKTQIFDSSEKIITELNKK